MSTVFKKLNLKDQQKIVVLDAPSTFESEVAQLGDVQVRRSIGREDSVDFLLAFVQRRVQVERLAGALAKKAPGDATIWFAYPKGSSKRYRCDFNRTTGFASVGKAGFEGVRQVSIDDDWSALRFRRVEFIKTMKRDPARAMTTEGKARAKNRTN